PRFAVIHAETLLRGTWSESFFAAQCEKPGVFAALCEEGFLLARIAADECEILTFAVLPQHQRQGIGRQLLEAALSQAASSQCRQMFLDVAEDNAQAVRLYEKAGFQTIGRRKGYYEGIDALLMRKDIGQIAAKQ